jgi:cyclic pyranopterin phosphate synthase
MTLENPNPGNEAAVFSHLETDGSVRMVDVGRKGVQRRTAIAECMVRCEAQTMQLLRECALPKGDVLTVAKIAAIQAAKRTDELIPLCHSLPLNSVDVQFEILQEGIRVRCTAVTDAKTGVEMEALTGASLAALTIYDMCKAVDKNMVIGDLRVTEKRKETLG